MRYLQNKTNLPKNKDQMTTEFNSNLGQKINGKSSTGCEMIDGEADRNLPFPALLLQSLLVLLLPQKNTTQCTICYYSLGYVRCRVASESNQPQLHPGIVVVVGGSPALS